MPKDGQASPQELERTRNLIDLFLMSMSLDDVRQFVREMEDELQKPLHLRLVK